METVKINEENLAEKLGLLDKTGYSKKVFIEYIKKFLREEQVLAPSYEFRAGADMAVNVTDLGGGKVRVTYRYEKGDAPTATVTAFVAEFGKEFPVNTEDITFSVTRRSYPLKEIRWDTVVPSVLRNQEQLSNIAVGSSYTQTVKNALPIDGNGTTLATGGTYSDQSGKGGALQSIITRRTRHFWGASLELNGPYPIHDQEFSSVLGTMPSEITVDHGRVPAHLVIVSTDNIEVTAKGITVGMQKVSNVPTACYQPNLAYSRNYNIYISTGKTTGIYTFGIKRL